MINEQEVRRAIATLKPDSTLFEVRAIDSKWNASGYFTDADTLVAELKKLPKRKNLNVYITLNSVKDDCYSRKQRDKLIEYATPTTSDNDILAYDWLMVDIDPKRAAGTSSTDEQISLCKQKGNDIIRYLRGRGWSDPLVALSGNGVHLLYPVGLRNTPDNVRLVQSCLTVLDMAFSNDIQIDQKTYNPARICKLYGTRAQKGSDTPDRPHRMSAIVQEHRGQVDKAQLESLASLLPKEQKPEKYNSYNPRAFDLEDWIVQHGLNVKKSDWSGGKKWVFDECPFDSSHTGKDAAIVQTADGKICFNCFHNSCSDKHWHELRLKYEPDAYDRKYVEPVKRPNYQNPDYRVVESVTQAEKDGEPIFYTTEQIRLLKTPPEEFIKTGIMVIDRKMRGLKKGFVTCFSGLRGSGKSSLISQLTIEAAEQGYRTALFSGELTSKNLYRWLILQAAGKYHVHPTQYENYYQPKQDAEPYISKWLDEKVFIYNNRYGNDFSKIMERLNECVVKHKVDLVILDNLMSLNISMLEQDKFTQQSAFVDRLETFAKDVNVHVLFVAHPRKAMGFLRMDDISGSADIGNRVDNAFIMHRVNNDFKRLSKQMFQWKEDKDVYKCHNVIEVSKDRATGLQDEFIPLFFDPTCKRLMNDEFENKVYAWENSFFQEVDIPDAPF